MGIFKKEKKRNYDAGNYQPTMILPLGSVAEGVGRALEKREKPEDRLGIVERIKIFFNKLGIRFSKLFIYIIAPGIFLYEKYLQNKYNFITMVLWYLALIYLVPIARKRRWVEVKGNK